MSSFYGPPRASGGSAAAAASASSRANLSAAGTAHSINAANGPPAFYDGADDDDGDDYSAAVSSHYRNNKNALDNKNKINSAYNDDDNVDDDDCDGIDERARGYGGRNAGKGVRTTHPRLARGQRRDGIKATALPTDADADADADADYSNYSTNKHAQQQQQQQNGGVVSYLHNTNPPGTQQPQHQQQQQMQQKQQKGSAKGTSGKAKGGSSEVALVSISPSNKSSTALTDPSGSSNSTAVASVETAVSDAAPATATSDWISGDSTTMTYTLVVTVLLFAFSTSMIMYNKYMVNFCPTEINPSPSGFAHTRHPPEERCPGWGFPFPLFVAAVQFVLHYGMGFVTVHVFKLVPPPQMTKREFWIVNIQGACVGLYVGLANMSFLFLEASFFEELRQLATVFTYVNRNYF